MCYTNKTFFFNEEENSEIFYLLISRKQDEKPKEMKEWESYFEMKVF